MAGSPSSRFDSVNSVSYSSSALEKLKN